jgi:hypothetical protein
MTVLVVVVVVVAEEDAHEEIVAAASMFVLFASAMFVLFASAMLAVAVVLLRAGPTVIQGDVLVLLSVTTVVHSRSLLLLAAVVPAVVVDVVVGAVTVTTAVSEGSASFSIANFLAMTSRRCARTIFLQLFPTPHKMTRLIQPKRTRNEAETHVPTKPVISFVSVSPPVPPPVE